MTKSVFTERYARLRQLLIEARQARGFTQQQIAERLEHPQSFVSKYESGERRLDVVEFIEVSHALELSAQHVIAMIEVAEERAQTHGQ